MSEVAAGREPNLPVLAALSPQEEFARAALAGIVVAQQAAPARGPSSAPSGQGLGASPAPLDNKAPWASVATSDGGTTAAVIPPTSPPMPAVADKIVRGLERRSPKITIGMEPRVNDLASRLAPGTANSLLGRFRHRLPFV